MNNDHSRKHQKLYNPVSCRVKNQRKKNPGVWRAVLKMDSEGARLFNMPSDFFFLRLCIACPKIFLRPMKAPRESSWVKMERTCRKVVVGSHFPLQRAVWRSTDLKSVTAGWANKKSSTMKLNCAPAGVPEMRGKMSSCTFLEGFRTSMYLTN